MIVTITGATGFVGRALVPSLVAKGHRVRLLAREPDRAKASLGVADAWRWDGGGAPPAEALTGADAVVHLMGEGVADKRWSAARKALLRRSRIDATRELVRAMAALPVKPAVFVSGSAIGYYGNVPDGALDEDAKPGADFLADLCREWEAAAWPAEQHGIRTIALRTGIVLGKGGGALAKMLPPFKLGAGGPLGNGRQWMSWIDLEDEVGLIHHALEKSGVRGPLNATAPEPATNADFSRALGEVLHRPAFMPAPAFAIRLAFGELAGVLLGGQNVVPKKALATGYRFARPVLEDALRASI